MTRQKPRSKKPEVPARISRGFVKTGGILSQRIRKATEKRGFAESRLLTQWDEIVGPATAAMAQPVKVSFGREGLGATLTILTNGANAPVLQVELPRIRDRVNACYGYAAISRIRITQTSESGFAEPAATFRPDPAKPRLNPEITAAIDTSVADVQSDDLRSALAVLGQNIISRKQTGTS